MNNEINENIVFEKVFTCLALFFMMKMIQPNNCPLGRA